METLITYALWGALVHYTILGGILFGANLCYLLAPGNRGEQQRSLIDNTIGPLWAVHHIWLLFLIICPLIALPDVFSTLINALFWPFILIVLGVLFQLATLLLRLPALRKGKSTPVLQILFRAGSLLTPLFIAISAAIVASGQIYGEANQATIKWFTPWVLPITLVWAALILSLCVALAATFLAIKAKDIQDEQLQSVFCWRALIASGLTIIWCVYGLILAPTDLPILWNNMTVTIFPILVAVCCAGATLFSLLVEEYRKARGWAIGAVTFLVMAWALAQYPYIIPFSLRDYVFASDSVLQPLLIGTGSVYACISRVCGCTSRNSDTAKHVLLRMCDNKEKKLMEELPGCAAGRPIRRKTTLCLKPCLRKSGTRMSCVMSQVNLLYFISTVTWFTRRLRPRHLAV